MVKRNYLKYQNFIECAIISAILFLSTPAKGQQYFEKVIPAPPAGERVREVASISEANDTSIRLGTWLIAEVNGPNISAGGYLDYYIADSSLGERLYWTSMSSPNPINQIFPQTSDSTLVIQSTDLEGRIHKYEWRNILYLNHSKGTYEYWPIRERRISSANVQKHQDNYYGLYSYKPFRGQWLQEDTIVMARLNFQNKSLDILSQYILPFQPDNAGFFRYRPEEGEFDFVFDKYKLTYALNNEYPISIDSTYYVHYNEHSPGSRATNLMCGYTIPRFRNKENLRVIRYDSLGDSSVYSFKQPKFSPDAESVPTAFSFDSDNNLLVVFNNVERAGGKVVSKFLQRIGPNEVVLQQVPLRLEMLQASILDVHEDTAGNIVLSGSVKNQSTGNIDSEIYLARLSPTGLSAEVELPISGELALVPNPASSAISIIGDEPNRVYQYRILNLAGQTMAVGQQYLNLNVDISFLSQGAYFFDITSIDGQPYTEAIRFLKY